jgi:hypothetical protein
MHRSGLAGRHVYSRRQWLRPLLTAAFLLLALPGAAQAGPYPQAVLVDGPSGYWRLGESSGSVAADESANTNLGVYANGVGLGQPGAISGDPDTAAAFDGTNDYLSAADTDSLDLTAGATLEAWVKRSKSGWQVIVGKPGNGQSRLESYGLWFDSGNFLRAYFGDRLTYGTISSTTPIDTAWHHFVATYDNATIKLYIDGALNKTQPSTVELTPNADALNIGRAGSDNTTFFGGLLDEVAIYPTALAASRITTHYETGRAIDATAPALTMSAPEDGSSSPDVTPDFSGQAGNAFGDSMSVTVAVYPGSSATGSPERTLTTTRTGDSWTVTPGTALAEGRYTAVARQTDAAGNVASATAGFTVDHTAPAVTLVRPAAGSVIDDPTPGFSGEAGSHTGDEQTVRVRIYGGTSASGTPIHTLSATRDDNSWAIEAPEALPEGIYTARAQQQDAAGNVGLSTAATFTVTAPQPPAASPYRDAVLSDGPKAFWRLGEASGTRAEDESGNVNHGSYVNGTALGHTGRIADDANTAVAFDGVNDYMTVPDSASLDLTAGATVEAWVKRAKSGTWQVVIGKPGNGQSKFENYAIWLDPSNFVRAFFGNGTTYATTSSTAPLDTNWHHVVTTYNNATVRLYIDGVQNATSTSTVNLTPNNQTLNLGREERNSQFFGGQLDDVAVYGTALPGDRVARHYEIANGVDTIAPAVTLTTPGAGSSTVDGTPAFAGAAAITGTDLPTVTVKVYEGTAPVGPALETLSTTHAPSGSWAVSAATPLGPGTYTAEAEQADQAGNVGRSSKTFSVVERQPAGTDAELVGAGDIAHCDSQGDEATAALIDGFPDATVFTVGDNAYERGTAQEFSSCYEPTWGRAKARTRPSLGDHDYADGADPTAAGYFGYFASQLAPFGPSATDPNRGYYSYDAGAWHVVVLNAVCGGAAPACSVPTQVSWLDADLAAHPTSCTMAILSAPRWSSGSVHGNNSSMQPYWEALHRGGVELVLSGDDHDYERFAPQNAQGAYRADGLRQFVVGTGGRSHYLFANGGVVRANSEVRNDTAYGILRLVLRSGTYEWEFVPEAGRTFMDAGSDSCH